MIASSIACQGGQAAVAVLFSIRLVTAPVGGVLAADRAVDGRAIGTGTDTVTGLDPGSRTRFEVGTTATYETDAATIEDCAFDVGDCGGSTLAVR